MKQNYRVVFPEKNKVELEACETPTLRDDEVLFATEISQISTGTELTMLQANVEQGSNWENLLKFPNYPGYSNVGRVVDVGAKVSRELIGKRFATGANHVRYYKFSTEEIATKNILPVPEGVASSDAVFSTIARIALASIRASKLQQGDACAVFGAGLVGQMVTRFARIGGSTRVFVADLSDERLGKLPDDPCVYPVNSGRTSVPDFVKEHTVANEGAAVVFEVTGLPSLLPEELRCLYRGGRLMITSSPRGKSQVDLEFCSRKHLTIIGAHNVTTHTPVETVRDRWTQRRDTAYFLELLEKKQIKVDGMHTHRAGFRDAVKLYEMLAEDRTKALSVCMTWED